MSIKLENPTIIEIYGCYYCYCIFNEEEIHTWHDNGRTPECPCCGIDSVTNYSTCSGIGNILIDLKLRAKKAWSIVEDKVNETK